MEEELGSDLLARLSRFAGAAGPIGVAVVGLMLIALVYMMVMRMRMGLVALFVTATVFSGFVVVPALDSGSTLFRWAVLFALAATGFAGWRSPGLPAFMLLGVGTLGLVMSFLGPLWWYTGQRSMLMIVFAGPVAWALAGSINGKEDAYRLYKMFLLAAGVYVLAAVANVSSFRAGARFAGGQAAPLFVMTGGMLLPVVVWATMQEALRRWRLYAVVTAVAMLALLVVSGQRTGTLAGLIGCLPLLTRIRARRLMLGAVVVSVAAIILLWVFVMAPEQGEYVQSRFLSTDLTGRSEIWAAAWQACTRNPWMGEGIGSSVLALQPHVILGRGVQPTTMHSAYLAAWYDTGVFGLALFVLAYLVLAAKSLRFIVSSADPELKDLGRLLLGIALACLAGGVAEESLFSPSNLAAFSGLTASIVVSRLAAVTSAARRAAGRERTPIPEPLWSAGRP